VLKMGVMDKCCKCGDEKEDYELTIHLISPYRHELMCETCHKKHRGSYDKKMIKKLSGKSVSSST